MGRKWNSHTLLTRIQNDTTTLEKSWPASQKVKHTLTPWSRFSTPRHLYKRNENIHTYKDLYVNIYSYVIHNHQKQKQSKCHSTNEWINKGTSIRRNTICWLERNKLLTRATTWIDLQNIMPGEGSWIQQATYSMMSFTWCSSKGKILRTKNLPMVSRDQRQKKGFSADGHEGTFLGQYKCSILCLCWWLHNCRHLGKLIKWCV